MVVGDVVTDMQVIDEGDSFIFGPPAGYEYEVTNIYLAHDMTMYINKGDTGTVISFGTISESQLSINLHIVETTFLELNNSGVGAAVVGVDGIVTRRPPTVFA